MLIAHKGEKTPEGMERVTIEITASGLFEVFMPKGEADDLDDTDDAFTDEAVQAPGDDLLNLLEFEASIVHIA